jgi:hypothetical protein
MAFYAARRVIRLTMHAAWIRGGLTGAGRR